MAQYEYCCKKCKKKFTVDKSYADSGTVEKHCKVEAKRIYSFGGFSINGKSRS